jgi:hypothetical protein
MNTSERWSTSILDKLAFPMFSILMMLLRRTEFFFHRPAHNKNLVSLGSSELLRLQEPIQDFNHRQLLKLQIDWEFAIGVPSLRRRI